MVNQLGWSSTLQRGATTVMISVTGSRIGMSIRQSDVTLIEDVNLGLAVDGRELAIGSTVSRATEIDVAHQWFAHSGKSAGAHDYVHNELLVELHHEETRRDWTLRIRVAPHGVAVRYGIPDLQGVATLTGDSTRFDLGAFERAWVLDYQTWYETPRAGVNLPDLADGEYGFPLLARSGEHHLLVTESGIDGRFPGAHPTLTAGSLAFTLADPATEIARGDVTPWRVFVVGSLADVTESLFVEELAPAVHPEPDEFTWVRPGRAAWSWWSDFYSGAQLDHQKRFVDAAAHLSWEHLLIDCGWEETWVPEIVAYASQRGIQVHLWTVWHDIDGPEKLARLALWRSWGIAGIKVDFMESESKDRYRWYDSVLQETARLGLMVNFHGSVIPRGWSRTWPQVIGYEAIRGSEYYVFYSDTALTAAHNVIQPFTRNVVGAMDYTPVAFSAPGRETSDAHELALCVAFESGITHFADGVDVYLGRPLVARFLTELAPMWDETLLLSGSPDTEAVVARRSGDRWFIGGIATGLSRTLSVPLARLGLQSPSAWVITDSSGGQDLVESTLRPVDALKVTIAENGGFVAIISDGELFRALPQSEVRVVTVTPERSELNANREAVISTDPEAFVRVAPGWAAENEGDGRWRVRAPQGVIPGSLGIATVELVGEVPVVAHARLFAPLTVGEHRFSDLPMLSFSNESGPVERDMSNGEGNPRDGARMTVAGAEFEHGFGVSTPSDLSVRSAVRDGRLLLSVGVDDETPGTAALIGVSGDGRELARGVIRSGERPLDIDVDVSGIEIITLSTREVVEGSLPAHVDWASARLVVTSTTNDSITPASRH